MQAEAISQDIPTEPCGILTKPVLPASNPLPHHKNKMKLPPSCSHLWVDFLEVGILFVHLKIEFRGGDRESALEYSRGGHQLSWRAQADRTCQQGKDNPHQPKARISKHPI